MSEKVAEDANAPVNADAAVEKRTDETDLDSLLAEFDQNTQKPVISQPEPKQELKIDPEDIAAVKEFRQHRLREDVDNVCKEVFDGLNVPVRGQRGWLVQLAFEDNRIERAFQNKDKDPSAWKKVVKYLKQEAQKEYTPSKVDEEATADHAAVAQAVRGASTKVAADPAPDFSKMSEGEFQRWKMDNMK